MDSIQEVAVGEVGKSMICSLAVSRERLYGSGSGKGPHSIFIVDLSSSKMIGRILNLSMVECYLISGIPNNIHI